MEHLKNNNNVIKMFILMVLLFKPTESLQVDFYCTKMNRTVTRLFVASGLKHAKILLALSFKRNYRMDRLHTVDEVQTEYNVC